MLDTVRGSLSGDWNFPSPSPRSPLPALPEGWRFSWSEGFANLKAGAAGQVAVLDRLQVVHGATGLRVMGSTERPHAFEVSLPRLVFPSNGHLINRQSHLDTAVETLRDMAGDVVAKPALGHASRLDLCWHFKCQVIEAVHALQNQRIPQVRSAARTYFGESVTWHGEECVVRFYDKGMEQMGRSVGVGRLEFQYRGRRCEAIREHAGETIDSMSVPALWEVYRSEVARIPALSQPLWDRPLSMTRFLALLRSQGVSLEGIPAEELYLRGRSERYRKVLRRRIARAEIPAFGNFGWDLPESITEASVYHVAQDEAA